MAKVEIKEIFGAKKVSEEKTIWTKIGVGFVNKDNSINLKFDFIPLDPSITIQLRDPKENRENE
jgi:hypothetical protein